MVKSSVNPPAMMDRATSRARLTVRNGALMLPGFASLPDGDTYSCAAVVGNSESSKNTHTHRILTTPYPLTMTAHLWSAGDQRSLGVPDLSLDHEGRHQSLDKSCRHRQRA